MSNIKFNASFLEGKYLVGDHLQMSNGVIKDNPFSKSVGNCLAANWLLENKEMVKMKIKSHMKSQGLGVHEVDECFGYAINFFLEREDREFNPHFFGDESSETYSIDIYCYSKLQHIVYEYRNEMRKRLKNNVYLVEIDKGEDASVPKNCISYDVLSKASFSEEKDKYGYENIMEFQELQEILDIEIPMYNEEFKILGLVNFNFRDFVYHIFLSDKEITLEGNNMSDEYMEEVAQKLGTSSSGLHKQIELVNSYMKNKKDMFKDVPGLVHRLIQGKLEGWVPVY